MADDVEILSQARVGGVLDDKWTLQRLLGVGGMAAVYGARHRNGARAAVKVLHPHLSRHAEVRERFLREGYAANRVEHPGAVKVLDDDIVSNGPDAGTAYLVMELLEGVSLQERLDRGLPIGELEFLRIAGNVLDVLQAAHARGVVHRDLKPENLFLVRLPDDEPSDRRARIKVLDFGLARLLQAQAITSFGLALGTPSFMSPEQATGQSDQVDGRTDLFALAATGFRVRTGRRIHEAPNAVELVRKMGTIAAPRLRTVAAEASEPFARVIDRALEFRREDRYESAEAMRRDLDRAIGEIDAGAGPTLIAVPASVPRLESIAPEPPTIVLEREDLITSGAAATSEPAAPPVRRRSRWVGYLAALLLAAIGIKMGPIAWSAIGASRLAAPSPLRFADAGASAWATATVAPQVVVAPPRDVEPEDAAAPAAPTASAAATKPPHVAPTKAGPAQIRKLPHKRRPLRPGAR